MLNHIRYRLQKEAKEFNNLLSAEYKFSQFSPILSSSIKDFTLRKSKLIRPIMYIIGYKGFSARNPAGLYKSAFSVELIHDFILIHDDIIDRSNLRRSKPSLHKIYETELLKHKNKKITGQDLAIVTGDILFSLAIHLYLSINENPKRKEKGLKKMMETAALTGCGQFLEIVNSAKSIEQIRESDIIKTYDNKTALYTFSAPLSIGATLAGASKKETTLLNKFGLYIGRAFQIKDDIPGLLNNTFSTGKPAANDIEQSKKTLTMLYAYKRSSGKDKLFIKNTLKKSRINSKDIIKIRAIMEKTGALEYSHKRIAILTNKAFTFISRSRIKEKYKNLLKDYCSELLA